MELTTRGFKTLCMDETVKVNGGGPLALAIIGAAAVVTAVGAAAKGCYELGTYVGKAIAHATN